MKKNPKTIQYKIQSLVLPTERKHKACRELFYKGDYGVIDEKTKTLCLAKYQFCDFNTYLNACSYRKWKKYTVAGALSVSIEFVGHIKISYTGYSKQGINTFNTLFATEEYSSETPKVITFTYPENNEQMVGFEVSAIEDSKIIDANYQVEVPEDAINDVVLSIATTTCHKEEFIKKNVGLIKDEILNGELSENIFLHVVDNGQTLTKSEIEGKHVILHPNKNSGGSGGFARGMIESMNQETPVTHILLMDDDVLVLPESIKRTYHLLKLQKEDCKNSFISGAMLYYENPAVQHEDIGSVSVIDGGFSSIKGALDHRLIEDSLENESEYPVIKNSYAAWWYCCIPVAMIKKNGLPLPIFIRTDDAEYGIRCNPDYFITMNGICVWHMGFVAKYNPTMDLYQQCRNLLIAKSTFNALSNIDLFKHKIYSIFRVEVTRFNYNAAELVVRAFEDYLKGPDFIMTVDGEKLMQENMALNPVFKPLEDLKYGDLFKITDSVIDPPLSFKNRLFLKITRNGNRFYPKGRMSKKVVPVGFSWGVYPQRIAKHSKLLAVNPYEKTGVLYELNKKRYKELNKRYRAAVRKYKKHGDEIRQEYQAKAAEMTSEEFWKKYLSI